MHTIKRTTYRAHTITTTRSAIGTYDILITDPYGQQKYYGLAKYMPISHSEAAAEAKDIIDEIYKERGYKS
jgi:hypothetical protein